MKHIVIFLLVAFNINAQTVGSFYPDKNIFRIEYKEYSTFLEGLVNENTGVLFVEENYTFYKTDFKESDFGANEIMAIDDTAIFVDDGNSNNYFSEIYIDLKKNKLTHYLFEEKILNKKFAVQEDTPKMKWEFLNEQKKIGEYNCEKVKTTFRGRTYEIWYTSEIPMASGPWKFNGLPGLILSVKDLAGIYSWEVSSISTVNNHEFSINNALEDNSTLEIVSFKDFDQKVMNALKERNRMVNIRGGGDIKFGFSTDQNIEPINEWRTQTYFEF